MLIDNINSIVKTNDILYHLGDFCFGRKHEIFEVAKKYRDQIKCQNVHLIWGNHDHRSIAPLFSSCHDMFELKHEKQLIVMCHYAMKVWRNSHHGSWQFFGHSHGSLPDDPQSLSFDVGVDCWGYKPISFEQAKEAMSHKLWKPIDHHGKEKQNEILPTMEKKEGISSD